MLITISSLAILLTVGSASAAAQNCLHGADETAAQRARRNAAIQLATRINLAQVITSGPRSQNNRYRPLEELVNIPPTPPGSSCGFIPTTTPISSPSKTGRTRAATSSSPTRTSSSTRQLHDATRQCWCRSKRADTLLPGDFHPEAVHEDFAVAAVAVVHPVCLIEDGFIESMFFALNQ